MTRFGSLFFAAALALSAACGDDDVTPPDDAGPPDAGDVPAPVDIPGLAAPVEAIQDDRGMWHIYGESREDVVRVEGYLMARDRFGQMEFFRRGTTGRLAEIAGDLDPSLVDRDVGARFMGYARGAEAVLATLPAEELALLDAFAAGVNTYIQRLRDGDEVLPRGVRDIFTLIDLELVDWTPIDTLSIGKFQAAALSYDLNDDVNMTRALTAWQNAFQSTSADARFAARADAFHDLYPFRPIHDVYTRDGFPNVGTDTGTRALRPPRRGAVRTPYRAPSADALLAASRFADGIEASFQRWFGDDTRGSNSWVVSGSHTASGAPLLANDPHLGLESPPLFWMVHLNTARGGGDLNVQGLAIAGTPVIILGFNDHIAWGLTTHGFDVTDAYQETITAGSPDTVAFEGGQVAIETITETVQIKGAAPMTVQFENVPHHGLIIPETRTATEAISVRYTGTEPTREVFAFVKLATAASVDEARDAYQDFGAGGQNLVVVDRAGDIFWSTQVNLPVRDARAMTYDPATRMGVAPCFVLPGDGDYEWTGTLSDRFLPHALNPTEGYIATANNDGVGTISDDHPFNDPHYIGWSFADGNRISRIRELLDEVTARGDVTVADMQRIQGDSLSPLGRLTAPVFAAELTRAEEELAAGGTHPDLTAVVAELGAATIAKLATMRDRLEGWTFETPAAVEGTPTAEDIAASSAATIFNVAYGRVLRGFMDDEADAMYGEMGGPGPSHVGFVLAVTQPDTLVSYDATLGGTVLWDDLTTSPVEETRGEIVVRAFADALQWLETEHGTDMDQWRWGNLHTLRLSTIVPQIGSDPLSIPTPDDPMFPNGFPRHGDRGVVDASSFSQGALDDFRYRSGPVQRLVVEMTPSGPQAHNALPGGEAQDPDSPHHADEIEHWRINAAPPMYFTDSDVEAAAETRETFMPIATP